MDKGPYIIGFHLHKISRIGKSTEIESRLVIGPEVVRWWWGPGWGVIAEEYRVSF